MKPIEPGCLALVIHGAPMFQGKTVEVLRVSNSPNHDWIVLVRDYGEVYGKTSQLMRIDGGEDEAITQSADDEVMA